MDAEPVLCSLSSCCAPALRDASLAVVLTAAEATTAQYNISWVDLTHETLCRSERALQRSSVQSSDKGQPLDLSKQEPRSFSQNF